MSRTAVYDTTVTWKGEHRGHLVMGNGPEMDFSAPPDAEGHAGIFTPEDAFVAVRSPGRAYQGPMTSSLTLPCPASIKPSCFAAALDRSIIRPFA